MIMVMTFKNATSHYNGVSCNGTHAWQYSVGCNSTTITSDNDMTKGVNPCENLTGFDAACDVGELCCSVSSLSYSSTAASHSRNHF